MGRAARTKPVKASKEPLATATGEPARVQLPAECVLRDAAGLQAQLLAAVSPADSVIVEAGAVTRIDAACLQLLVAFAQREAAAGRRIAWQDPTPALIESSARVGLSVVLGLPARVEEVA
jgi:anti-anti-sigma regulatory factor